MTNGLLNSKPFNPLEDPDNRVLLTKLAHSQEGEALLLWLEFQAMLVHRSLLEPNPAPEDPKLDNLIGRAQMIETVARMLNGRKNDAN
jgi:hypothetical protein